MTLCSDWITQEDVELCYAIPEGTDADVIASALTVASELLYALSGRQYPGTCSEIVRPCGNEGDPLGFTPWLWSYPWVPIRTGGQWVNTGPCGCHMRSCGCGPYPSVNLGRPDVQTVTEVKIDGAVLASSAYRLDSNQYLTRVDGDSWPCCQDLSEPTTEAGTWSVSITYGFAVPEALKRAAAVFASELIKDCIGEDCRLPRRTTTVTRQGLTFDMLDPQQFLTEGRTGLYEVDLVVAAFNPHGLTRRAMAWSPEVGGRGLRA